MFATYFEKGAYLKEIVFWDIWLDLYFEMTYLKLVAYFISRSSFFSLQIANHMDHTLCKGGCVLRYLVGLIF